MTETNEAAERLLEQIQSIQGPMLSNRLRPLIEQHDAEVRGSLCECGHPLFGVCPEPNVEALAAERLLERQATVERIRAEVQKKAGTILLGFRISDFLAILDEEAAR